MEHMYAAGLQKIASLGAVRIRKLVDHFGSFEAAWKASAEDIKAMNLFGPKQLSTFLSGKRKIEPEAEYEKIRKNNINILTYRDSDYPYLLSSCVNAPAVLSYKGVWPAMEKTIAIVGSRKVTPYGQNVCRHFATELAKQEVVIVSGGARGIDSISHQACLEYMPTICVLACGLDITYPPENKKLFQRISENGVLVTEYSLGTKPLGRQFPARNRIISGLSRGVLVVEAAQRSGSLITADFALEEGRDVFAVPGSVFSKMSEGTHHLIRQGAIFAASPEDVLNEYGWLPNETMKSDSSTHKIDLSAEEELVFRCCCLEDAVDIDTIIIRSAMNPVKVNYLLLQLEIKGLIKNVGNQQYIAVVNNRR